MARRSFRRPDLRPRRPARATQVKEGRRPARVRALSLTEVSTPASSPRSKRRFSALTANTVSAGNGRGSLTFRVNQRRRHLSGEVSYAFQLNAWIETFFGV